MTNHPKAKKATRINEILINKLDSEMSQKTELIQIKNLTKKFSNFVALDGLDLAIEENTCVGFLGPNGAGKSTTIKILTGLIRPSSGQTFILGNDVSKDIRSALSDVGVLVEIPQFYSNLTPNETLSYFGKLRGMEKKRSGR